jgi:hypothetical protein
MSYCDSEKRQEDMVKHGRNDSRVRQNGLAIESSWAVRRNAATWPLQASAGCAWTGGAGDAGAPPAGQEGSDVREVSSYGLLWGVGGVRKNRAATDFTDKLLPGSQSGRSGSEPGQWFTGLSPISPKGAMGAAFSETYGVSAQARRKTRTQRVRESSSVKSG